MATVSRKVYFFRLVVAPNGDGTIPKLAIPDMLAEIKTLKFLKNYSVGPTSRYADTKAGLLGAWPNAPKSGELRLQLGRIRREDLPSVENAGDVSDLPLGPDDSLVDTTHMQFFRKNIVGCEFNFHGPRPSALRLYCKDRLRALPSFRLYPLLKRNILLELDRLGELREVDVRIRASADELMEKADGSFPAALRASKDQYKAETLELILRSSRDKPLSKKVRDFVRRLLSASADPQHDFKTLKVTGKEDDGHKLEEIDLLGDKLISTHTVARLKASSRAVDPVSMYTAIEDAYNTLRSELEAAPAAGIDE